jgi:IS1 family transposase
VPGFKEEDRAGIRTNVLDAKHKSSYINGVNKLPLAMRVQILSLLCEGSSMRSISRVCDVSINTVAKMLVEAGTVCMAFHDEKVRDVTAKRVQCDEIWSFTAAKGKTVPKMKRPVERAGDTWTWTAIDADSKLIISWLVGDRDAAYATAFFNDLKDRIVNRIQLSTDGNAAYLTAVEDADFDVDYAMLVKIYGLPSSEAERRYSPEICIGAKKRTIMGNPDPAHISTSYVERQNLTMRMHMRRFTRLTNAFSKKFESHVQMVALYTVWYNWCRIHKTLRVTPAMAAGITDRVWDFADIVAMMDAVAPKPGRPKTYKKRVALTSKE